MMNNVRYLAAILPLLCLAGRIAAQNDSLLPPPPYVSSFEYLLREEAWLESENAAGLQYFPAPKASLAEVYFNKSNGRFVNYHRSDNSMEWGARTESFIRLNPRVVFYGKVHYAGFSGKNMGGSVFIDPYAHPFDIVEMNDNARGEKSSENYHLAGAASIGLSPRWTMGGKIDYRAANYAKYKDLRHANMLLDLTTTLGISYRPGTTFNAGINCFYRRSVESLQLEMYGTTDKVYYSLVSFGSFYGHSEIYGSGGYTDKDVANPAVNIFQGIALQLNLQPVDRWNFFSELSCKRREGFYGKRSPNTPVYMEHHAEIVACSGTLLYKRCRQQHRLKISARHERLENNENIFRIDPSPGGGWKDVHYFGSNKILGRTLLNANAVYVADLLVKDHLPAWTLQAGGDFFSRQQKVSVFPFYRKQNIRSFGAFVSACRNRMLDRKNMYTLSLGASYASGSGAAYNDGTSQTPSESQKAPETTVFNLYREYDCLTAPRLKGNAGAACSRLLTPTLRGYVRANYECTRAWNIRYPENKTFGSATLTIGCLF